MSICNYITTAATRFAGAVMPQSRAEGAKIATVAVIAGGLIGTGAAVAVTCIALSRNFIARRNTPPEDKVPTHFDVTPLPSPVAGVHDDHKEPQTEADLPRGEIRRPSPLDVDPISDQQDIEVSTPVENPASPMVQRGQFSPSLFRTAEKTNYTCQHCKKTFHNKCNFNQHHWCGKRMIDLIAKQDLENQSPFY